MQGAKFCKGVPAGAKRIAERPTLAPAQVLPAWIDGLRADGVEKVCPVCGCAKPTCAQLGDADGTPIICASCALKEYAKDGIDR